MFTLNFVRILSNVRRTEACAFSNDYFTNGPLQCSCSCMTPKKVPPKNTNFKEGDSLLPINQPLNLMPLFSGLSLLTHIPCSD